MKTMIHPFYEYLSDYLLTLPERFDAEGETIYAARNTIKVFTAPDGTTLNVKRYHPPRFFNRLIYSFGLRRPKGLRAFTYPEILEARDIDTPAPVAYFEERHGGMLGYSYFVSVQCQGMRTLYDVATMKTGYELLAEELGTFTARMHEQQVLHRDYTPGNILWRQEDLGVFTFVLVDTNRMRFGTVSQRRGCKNICRFWGPKHFTELLAKHYALSRGFDVEDTVNLTLRYRQQFWKRFSKRHSVPFELEY